MMIDFDTLTRMEHDPKKRKVTIDGRMMEEILHQLIGNSSHYLQGFIHPMWLALGFLNHQQQKRMIFR